MTLILVLPGSTADLLMGVLLEKPRASSTSERLTAAVLLSVAGVVMVELAHVGMVASATVGDYLLRPLLTPEPVANEAALRYLVYFFVTVAAPLTLRWVVAHPTVEAKLPAGWTVDARSLDRARRHGPRTPDGGSLLVRCMLDDGYLDGFLRWVPTIGHDPDPGYVIRSKSDETIHWVPLRSVKSISFLSERE